MTSRPQLRIVSAVLAGVVGWVLGWLVVGPWSGEDSFPPTCFSVFGYEIPCDGLLAPAVAGTVAVVAAALTWRFARRP